MEKGGSPYYQNILKKIEDYQKGEIPLDELKRIPKEDLLQAMRDECNRISSRITDLNREIKGSNPAGNNSLNSTSNNSTN